MREIIVKPELKMKKNQFSPKKTLDVSPFFLPVISNSINFDEISNIDFEKIIKDLVILCAK
jgi:hypothetical protein